MPGENVVFVVVRCAGQVLAVALPVAVLVRAKLFRDGQRLVLVLALQVTVFEIDVHSEGIAAAAQLAVTVADVPRRFAMDLSPVLLHRRAR